MLAGRVEPAAPGVRVQWRSGDWAGAAAETTTDARGAFKFEGVASGVLLVEAEGEQGSAAARAAAGTRDLVLRLARGRLKVFVQDERGGAISDFALTLVPQSGGLVRRFPVLSPTGIFTVDLPAGIWRVEASAAGYTDGPAQTVEVRGAESEARLMLAKGGPVRGVVRDAVSRLPIRGAAVTLIPAVVVGVRLVRCRIVRRIRCRSWLLRGSLDRSLSSEGRRWLSLRLRGPRFSVDRQG